MTTFAIIICLTFLVSIASLICCVLNQKQTHKLKEEIKSLGWPKHTGHSECTHHPFDRHGRPLCEYCENYHHGNCSTNV